MGIDITLILTIIASAGSTITAIVLILTYFQDKKRDKPQFAFYSVWGSSSPNDPNRKPVGLHIQNPSKPIDYCQVFCDGVALDTPFGAYFEKGIYIHAGGAADFVLPKSISEKDNPMIIVKDGKSILKKKQLKEIPHAL